jgi:hypothetical protein
MDAETIANIYRSHPVRMRFGFVVAMFGIMLFIPFGAALASQISRFEKRVGMLSISAAFGSFSLSMFGFYSAIWWLVTAFRPERDPEITLTLSDSAWLQFVGGASLCLPLFVAVAVVAFTGGGSTALYPRWLGWLTTLIILMIIPCSQMAFFFYSGPGAWNGLLPFWVANSDLTVWLIAMVYVMVRAARTADAQDTPHPESAFC